MLCVQSLYILVWFFHLAKGMFKFRTPQHKVGGFFFFFGATAILIKFQDILKNPNTLQYP